MLDEEGGKEFRRTMASQVRDKSLGMFLPRLNLNRNKKMRKNPLRLPFLHP